MFGKFFNPRAALIGAMALAPCAALAVAGDEPLAKILNTSPLYADSGVSYHSCTYVNVATSPILIKVDLLKSDGSTLGSTGSSAITLAAGTVGQLAVGNYTGFARCRYTVLGGGDSLRGNISVVRPTGTNFDTLAVSEAR